MVKSYCAIKFTSLANLFSYTLFEDSFEILLAKIFLTDNPVLNLLRKYLKPNAPSIAVPELFPIINEGSPKSKTSTDEKSCTV